jgi:hypothetical protein
MNLVIDIHILLTQQPSEPELSIPPTNRSKQRHSDEYVANTKELL